jgi:hypothetical protein
MYKRIHALIYIGMPQSGQILVFARFIAIVEHGMTPCPDCWQKREKTVFFLFCGKQAKINALIFLFYCVSSILSVKGWGLPAVLAWHDAMLFYCGQVTGAGLNTAS